MIATDWIGVFAKIIHEIMNHEWFKLFWEKFEKLRRSIVRFAHENSLYDIINEIFVYLTIPKWIIQSRTIQTADGGPHSF